MSKSNDVVELAPTEADEDAPGADGGSEEPETEEEKARRRAEARKRRQERLSAIDSKWLTYEQTAEYTGWSIRYLRNLVSADAIPVYGEPRSRRFRRDMLDLFLTNRDAAMRKFRLERSTHHGN